jgi:hypothetical protein
MHAMLQSMLLLRSNTISKSLQLHELMSLKARRLHLNSNITESQLVVQAVCMAAIDAAAATVLRCQARGC